jgi:hypothetical protein
MKVAVAIIAAVAVLALLGESRRDDAPAFAPGTSKGAWLAATGTAPLDGPSALVLLERLKALGADSIALGPDVLQPRLDAPELEWGRDDDALRFVLRAAREYGFKTFVMPRVESPDFFKPPYPWRGTMTFERPDVRAAWYDAYRRMIRHYGRLCAEEGVATFGIGLEYRKPRRRRPEGMAQDRRGGARGLPGDAHVLRQLGRLRPHRVVGRRSTSWESAPTSKSSKTRFPTGSTSTRRR